MTNAAKAKRIAKWTAALRLRDWNIDVKETPNFANTTMFGSTSTAAAFGDAHILIRAGLSDLEWERTLVHELLHVRFPDFQFPDGSVLERQLEVGVEVLARLLVGRGK